MSVDATPANVPYEALRAALGYDRKLGGGYREEIEGKLTKVAPKAALVYINKGRLKEAKTAIGESAAGGTLDIAKQLLDKAAGKLYTEAVGDLADDPAGAKEKLKQIIAVTEPGSSWHKKATQKLSDAR